MRDQLDPGYCPIIDKFFLMGKTEVSSVPMYVLMAPASEKDHPHSHIFLTSSNFIMFLESRKELISTWELVLKATNNKDKTKGGKGLTIEHTDEFVQSHFSDGVLMKYLNMIIYYKIR